MALFAGGISKAASRPWWLRGIMGLSVLALLLSILLSWHYLSGGAMIGCGGGSSCDSVLASKWSALGGVLPISSLAVGVYLAIFVSSFYIGANTETTIRILAWQAMLVLAGAVTGSALWFTAVQKWMIGSFCPYCMTTHITGLLLSSLIIWRALKEPASQLAKTVDGKEKVKNNITKSDLPPMIRPVHIIGLTFSGLLLSGLLVAAQVAMAPSSVYKGGSSQSNLPMIDYHKAPIMGSADAPYKVTLLFDYQCPHCQKIHFMMNEVVRQYKGKLAVVVCPTPLNTKCNRYIPKDNDAFKNSCELAKIGLAVWKANREAFPEFEHWMFTFESGDKWMPRTLEATRQKSGELVGKAKLEAALSDPWIDEYLQLCVGIFGQTLQSGKGGIPKLVYESRWVIPEPENTDDLIRILQKSLGLPLP